MTPKNPSDPKDRSATMEGDEKQSYPPSRSIPGRWAAAADLPPGIAPSGSLGNYLGDYLRDDSKAYELRVREIQGRRGGTVSERMKRIKNVDRIVVVTRLYRETA